MQSNAALLTLGHILTHAACLCFQGTTSSPYEAAIQLKKKRASEGVSDGQDWRWQVNKRQKVYFPLPLTHTAYCFASLVNMHNGSVSCGLFLKHFTGALPLPLVQHSPPPPPCPAISLAPFLLPWLECCNC